MYGRFEFECGLAAAAVGVIQALAGCQAAQPRQSAVPEQVPHVVTADIQAGIERHIEDATEKGGGYFHLPHNGETLRLKLVRVHLEYLANLGPRRHFACVDLANIDGNVYDVDFFLEGDPGAMRVTETTIHKLNGQPYYVWEQHSNGTWARVPVDSASRPLLGVVEGADAFEFVYQATLPELDDEARMWIPLPESDALQTVEVKSIKTPGRRQVLTDQRYGNKVLFLALGPQHSGQSLDLRFLVHRLEKRPYQDPAGQPDQFLAPERLVPRAPEFDKIAADVLAGKEGELVRARALYDHTIDRMRYMRYGPGWGRGDAVYARDAGRGNCTDYHAYFIALCRAAGIPARFGIGAAIPSERDEGGIDGYHCWAEFHAEGKWWPVDLSEADKYSSLSTYYFGRHPANRIELSRGRDLVVEPGPASGPLNYLADPVLEVAGKPVAIKPQYSFRRTNRTQSQPPT